MKAGDTFRFRVGDPHLWMVISDPDIDAERVLIVNITTWRADKDQSCLLGPEHHDSITHNSCVQYPMSRVYHDRHLNSLLAQNKIVLTAPLAPAVLKMVREGAATSTRMKLAHGQIILEQGLVDLYELSLGPCRKRNIMRNPVALPNRSFARIFLSLTLLSPLIFPVLCLAEQPRPADALRDAYREDAEKTVFTRADGQPLKLVADPIMRWANDDDWSGDVFAWTYEGRPEVVGCILSGPGANKLRYVYHEYHMLADQPIAAANVQDGRRWQPAEGLKRERLSDAPKPADSPSARLAQMRKIARSFTAQMEADGRWELRLLPQPLMRYGDGEGEVIGGALFCYVWTKGTDPEVILLVECRRDGDESAWYYAPVLFTNREVWLKHGEREVWHVQPHREPSGKSTTLIYTTGFARSMPDKKAEAKSQKSK